jgi:hypothetical protein
MPATGREAFAAARALSFTPPSSVNIHSVPPLMDPPNASVRKSAHPPPLTMRILSLVSPEKEVDNKFMEKSGTSYDTHPIKPDPITTTFSSPTTSVTQAMKADLEDLITYIDEMTDDGCEKSSPIKDRLMTFFENCPTPIKLHGESITRNVRESRSKSKPRHSQPIFRDRTNQETSVLVHLKEQKPDPSRISSHKRICGADDRLEPLGSPPSRETSLYFHDDSLSMILSQSSNEAVDTINASAIDQTVQVSVSPPPKSQCTQMTSSPQITSSSTSTLRPSDILPPTSRVNKYFMEENETRKIKSITFRNVAKDPTPTKISPECNATPQLSRASIVRESAFKIDHDGNDIGHCWQVTPSRELSSTSAEGLFFCHSRLRSRKPTPCAKRCNTTVSVSDQDELHEGESSIAQDLNEITDSSETATPRPQLKSTPSIVSPDIARKILETAVDALKDARQEREIARQWAQDMKGSVQQWVEEQRDLMRTESASVAATSAASSAQVQQLESSINKLQREIARSHSTRTNNERKLERLLLQQEDQIYSMAHQLHVVQDQLALMRTSDSTKDGRSTINIPKCPARQEKNYLPSYRRHLTPSKYNLADRHQMDSSGRWSETSVASSHASRTRRSTPNGGHLVDYGNGVTKEVHPDGTTVTRFANGDVETRFNDISSPQSCGKKEGIVAYFHNKEGVLQITQKDGSVLYEYSNGQMERHQKDGTKVVMFPDGSKTVVRSAC